MFAHNSSTGFPFTLNINSIWQLVNISYWTKLIDWKSGHMLLHGLYLKRRSLWFCHFADFSRFYVSHGENIWN